MKNLITFVLPIILFCLNDISAQDAGEDCSDALSLEVTTNCIFQTFSNEGASDSPTPDPSCGAYQGGDVWFAVTMPSSGHLVADLKPNFTNDNVNYSLTAYTGTCGSLMEYDCRTLAGYGSDDSKGATIIIHDDALVGQTVYLRVYRYNNRFGGSFDICVFEPDIPDNDFCSAAVNLGTPEGEVCTFASYSNELVTDSGQAGPDPSCGAYQGGDVWFTVTMPSSGELIVDVAPTQDNGNQNYSLAAYQGECGSLVEYDCSTLGGIFDETNGAAIVINDVSIAGQTLYFRIFSYNTRFGGSFNFCADEFLVNTNFVNPSINFDIYPNPGRDHIIVHLPLQSNERMDLKVLDLSGKMIIQQTINKKENTVNIADLTPGSYLLQIVNQGDVAFKKFIKL